MVVAIETDAVIIYKTRCWAGGAIMWNNAAFANFGEMVTK